MPPETVAALLAEGRRRLAVSGSATPALDARLLLQHVAGLSHEEIVSSPSREVAAGAEFRELIARRERHEPVSRILGTREFYGRVFNVTRAVLDPRPETEIVVEEALRLGQPDARILDLGTGSGAIIVTLLAEWPGATGVATDVSPAALAVAGDNARRLLGSGRLRFSQGNWFEGVVGEFDLIVSNPPYIAHADLGGLPPDVRDFDPGVALDGGADGLAAYRQIAGPARAHLSGHGLILVEIGAGQKREVEAIFRLAGFALVADKTDLAGHVRCLAFG